MLNCLRYLGVPLAWPVKWSIDRRLRKIALIRDGEHQNDAEVFYVERSTTCNAFRFPHCELNSRATTAWSATKLRQLFCLVYASLENLGYKLTDFDSLAGPVAHPWQKCAHKKALAPLAAKQNDENQLHSATLSQPSPVAGNHHHPAPLWFGGLVKPHCGRLLYSRLDQR